MRRRREPVEGPVGGFDEFLSIVQRRRAARFDKQLSVDERSAVLAALDVEFEEWRQAKRANDSRQA